jgi:hypothetical protein
MQIVFAHFYSRLPHHLVLNLKRTVSLFPEHEVCLITDQDYSQIYIPDLQIMKYDPSPNWYKIERNLSHPADFRNNFWFISLARFIAIAEVSREWSKSILHVESDVLLAPDFPFELFWTLKEDFAFPIVSQDLAIASCLYIKNGCAAGELAKFTMDSVLSNNSTTDMYILKDFVNQYPEKVRVIPSAPYQPNAFQNSSEEFLNQTKSAISYFHGIFDGFDIGRFLFGDDPRNDRGFSVLRRNDSRTYLDASKIDLLVTEERDFPSVRNSLDLSVVPIYSLHIHSKKLNIFRENHTNKLIRKAILNSKNKSRIVFSFSIFFKSLILALRRRIKSVRFLR